MITSLSEIKRAFQSLGPRETLLPQTLHASQESHVNRNRDE